MTQSPDIPRLPAAPLALPGLGSDLVHNARVFAAHYSDTRVGRATIKAHSNFLCPSCCRDHKQGTGMRKLSRSVPMRLTDPEEVVSGYGSTFEGRRIGTCERFRYVCERCALEYFKTEQLNGKDHTT